MTYTLDLRSSMTVSLRILSVVAVLLLAIFWKEIRDAVKRWYDPPEQPKKFGLGRVVVDFGTYGAAYALPPPPPARADKTSFGRVRVFRSDYAGVAKEKTPAVVLVSQDGKKLLTLGQSAIEAYAEDADTGDFVSGRLLFVDLMTSLARSSSGGSSGLISSVPHGPLADTRAGRSVAVSKQPAAAILALVISHVVGAAEATLRGDLDAGTSFSTISDALLVVPSAWSNGDLDSLYHAINATRSATWNIRFVSELAAGLTSIAFSNDWTKGVVLSPLKGTPYGPCIIIDAGAAAVRVAIVSVLSLPPGRTEISIKRLRIVRAGGGSRINDAFEALLHEGISESDWARLHHSDRLELQREFESGKRYLTDADSAPESSILVSLRAVTSRLHPTSPTDFVRNIAKAINLSALRSGKFKPANGADGVLSDGLSLRLRRDFVANVLFSSVTATVAEELRDALKQPEARGTAAVVVFGGFARSDVLVESLRGVLPRSSSIPFIVASDPELAVARGAALMSTIMSTNAELGPTPSLHKWPIGVNSSAAAVVV